MPTEVEDLLRRLAPQVLGFVGVDATGLAGLEYEYEDVLAGTSGTRTVELDGDGLPIASGIEILEPAIAGRTLVTISEDPARRQGIESLREFLSTPEAAKIMATYGLRSTAVPMTLPTPEGSIGEIKASASPNAAQVAAVVAAALLIDDATDEELATALAWGVLAGGVLQLLVQLPAVPIMAKVPRIIKVPEGEVWVETENPLGQMGYYIVSKGATGPFRVKIRSASFSNVSILPWLLRGVYVPDVITILGSLYFILGDIDR